MAAWQSRPPGLVRVWVDNWLEPAYSPQVTLTIVGTNYSVSSKPDKDGGLPGTDVLTYQGGLTYHLTLNDNGESVYAAYLLVTPITDEDEYDETVWFTIASPSSQDPPAMVTIKDSDPERLTLEVSISPAYEANREPGQYRISPAPVGSSSPSICTSFRLIVDATGAQLNPQLASNNLAVPATGKGEPEKVSGTVS